MQLDVQKREKQLQEEKLNERITVENYIRKRQELIKTNSVQDMFPFDEIYPDGTMRFGNNYSQTMSFHDMNYSLATDEEKTEIFNVWCDIHNYFDSSVKCQLTYLTRKMHDADLNRLVLIAPKVDAYSDVRDEYNSMLSEKLKEGNNSIKKEKYLSFSIVANDYESARNRLQKIQSDIQQKFAKLGIQAFKLDYTQRVQLLHQILNPDEPQTLADMSTIVDSGLTTKDIIAPTSIVFDTKKGKYFKLNDTYNSIGYLQILAPELEDKFLSLLLDEDNNMLANFSIKAVDQHEAMKFVKGKLSDLESMKIEEQKKAIKSGYDMDILPPELKTKIAEANSLLEDLQSRNERMFLVTITLWYTAHSIEELDNILFQASSTCQSANIQFRIANYQMEESLNTSLPFVQNHLFLDRRLTTTSTAIFIPFNTRELFQTHGKPLYYGLNESSKNMIMADRKHLRNPNGLFLGTPGSGKSFLAKREMTNVFLATEDDMMIIDPEREYSALVNALGGQVVTISMTSQHRLNPLDINLNNLDDGDPITMKADFVLSMAELIIGGNRGLTPLERSIIDRAVRETYKGYLEDPKPQNMPILTDLYNALKAQPEPEAEQLAGAFEMYVTGSLKVFNHQTNVDLRNRVICFDIQEIGKTLRQLGMLIVQDQIWGRVTKNRNISKATRLYIDEFHLLLTEPQTASYSVEIWKRFRKWGGIPTGMTQNVKDLLRSPEIENILDNTDFVCLLNQSSGDRSILCNKLGISESQEKYITTAQQGAGLIIYDNVILPFNDVFPKNTKLYKLLSTKPGEDHEDEKLQA